MDRKIVLFLIPEHLETLALLTRMRLEFCEEQEGDPEYAEEAADLRALADALTTDCRNCGGDGFSCEGGTCPACKGGE